MSGEPRRVETLDGEAMACELRFPEDTPWVGGHFPGNPIVPGIALLDLVQRAAELEWTDSDVHIVSVSRWRFRSIVRPGDTVRLGLTADDGEGESWHVSITGKDGVVCHGSATIRRTPKAHGE